MRNGERSAVNRLMNYQRDAWSSIVSTIDKTTDLVMPEGLSATGQRAYAIITAYLKERGFKDNGSCQAFFSPAEWAARE